MSAPLNKSGDPTKSYTFDAIPEDEDTQEALNRRLRKPGEPGYCAPPKDGDASSVQAANQPESRK